MSIKQLIAYYLLLAILLLIACVTERYLIWVSIGAWHRYQRQGRYNLPDLIACAISITISLLLPIFTSMGIFEIAKSI